MPAAPHPTERRTTAPRTPRIPQRVLDDLAKGLKREQMQDPTLTIPKGLAEHNPAAALEAYMKQLTEPMKTEPVIEVREGALYINGHRHPSGTVSLTELLQAMRSVPPAPPALRGGKRGSRQTKKTT